MKHAYLLVLLALAATTAYAQLTNPGEGETVIHNRYQLVAGTDGSMWRVDTAAGFVHRCFGGTQTVTCVRAK